MLTVEEHLTVVARPGDRGLERVYKIFPRLEEPG
jgi:branched-chain amino acid transport system ATP-binding protein